MVDSRWTNWMARLHLGMAYQTFGRPKDADRLFQQLVRECGEENTRERARIELMKMRSVCDATIPRISTRREAGVRTYWNLKHVR